MKKNTKNKLYLAGPISGWDIKLVVARFGTTQLRLESRGYEVVNPLRLVGQKHDIGTVDWKDAMKICIDEIFKLSKDPNFLGIYFLENYQMSKGAMIEKIIAENLGIKMYNINGKDFKSIHG